MSSYVAIFTHFDFDLILFCYEPYYLYGNLIGFGFTLIIMSIDHFDVLTLMFYFCLDIFTLLLKSEVIFSTFFRCVQSSIMEFIINHGKVFQSLQYNS